MHLAVTAADAADAAAAAPPGATTLFVKNLNFNTSDEMLLAHFEREVPVRSARVAVTRDAKTNGKKSMGFGFVEFADKDDALKAIKNLQHSELDGHKVELKISTKGKDASGPEREGKVLKAAGTKLLIRNLAFETDKKEVKELCTAFGQIKSLRMPKKFDGGHRGFAFVDFVSKKEAKNAFEALSVSTHLYGRRMVIEWATDDTSVEGMQHKTKQSFDGGGPGANRAKKGRFEGEEGSALQFM